ncbi:MAG: cysteine desulfurase family protein [Candidatus Wolfebacteria bacterium]|nr:cysteine desulfurase family protein [Candidatus Wolfebacteria bacterium]
MKKSAYLDYAASTYLDPSVIKKMMPYLKGYFGNASALHEPGRESKAIIEKARGDIAEILGAKREEIIFTGGGTEADNLAIMGAARANKNKGSHIIVSKIEHKAILEAAKKLESEGFRVTYADVDSFGLIKIKELKKLIKKDTTLISIAIANNEIGVIQPIAEISKIIKSVKKDGFPLFHTDAVQAAGAISLKIDTLGVDLLTLNSSKIYGPKGIGCLYVRQGVKLEPIIIGGEQEEQLRAGTENVASIFGFAEALKLAERLRLKESKRLIDLRDYFIKNIIKSIPDCRLNGHPAKRLPNNINISVKGVEGESLLLLLDSLGVYVSTGSACASSDLEPSHVISAIDTSPELSHSNIRLTLGRKTTKKEIDYVLSVLPKAVTKLRTISSVK